MEYEFGLNIDSVLALRANSSIFLQCGKCKVHKIPLFPLSGTLFHFFKVTTLQIAPSYLLPHLPVQTPSPVVVIPSLDAILEVTEASSTPLHPFPHF